MFDDDTVLSQPPPPLQHHTRTRVTGNIDALQEFFEHINTFAHDFISCQEWGDEEFCFCIDDAFGEKDLLFNLFSKEIQNFWSEELEITCKWEEPSCQDQST